MLNKINSKKEPYSDMVESATPKPKSEYVAQNYIPSRLFVDNWIPSEYSKLTSLRAINDNTLKEQKKLFDLITQKWTDADKIIEQQKAIISIFWANEIINVRYPVLCGVPFHYVSSKSFKEDSSHIFYSFVYAVEFKEQNHSLCKNHHGNPIANGMMVSFNIGKDKIYEARVKNVELDDCNLIITSTNETEKDRIKTEDIKRLDGKVFYLYESPIYLMQSIQIACTDRLKASNLHQLIVPNPIFHESHDEYLYRKDKEMSEFVRAYSIPSYLHAAQKDVIFTICNKEHKTFPFIFNGAIGTGKTCTIIQAVLVLLQMNEQNRILICTPYNTAADRVAEELMKYFGEIMNSENVLRLQSERSDYNSRNVKFDSIIDFDDKEEVYKIPKNFSKWRVIVSTLGCCSHIVKQEKFGLFSHIFVDEAAQCHESDYFIPLGGLATPSTSIILCGDHKQLGPNFAKIDLSMKLKKKFISPLVRYMNMDAYKSDKRLSCQLIESYRCHPSLTRLVSELFYGGILRPTRGPKTEFKFDGTGMRADFPILFVSAHGCEDVNDENSYGNYEEARICVDIVKFLLSKKKVYSKEIGVISPYIYQSRLISKLMKDKITEFSRVDVASVERYQGTERDIIVMTTTRTGKLGFLTDDLRVNTSLTRATKILIVIGNEKALKQHPSWKSFIKYCKYNNAFKEWKSICDIYI